MKRLGVAEFITLVFILVCLPTAFALGHLMVRPFAKACMAQQAIYVVGSCYKEIVVKEVDVNVTIIPVRVIRHENETGGRGKGR